MLEIGYLSLDNPIVIVSSDYKSRKLNGSAGLLMLEGLDLDKVSLSEVESSFKEINTTSALGLSVTCSEDQPLIKAAMFACINLYLLELNQCEKMDVRMLYDLVRRIKRYGTTLAVRIRPEFISDDMVKGLKNVGLDLIHIDLRGKNKTAPKIVKKISDLRGPRIMALGDIGSFEDVKSLLAMGADLVSLRADDHEFAEWLPQAMRDYESLSGWYNAPKHICSGGDLRGLSFCCPPVKQCPLYGALRKLDVTPEEFVELKLRLAKGTPLEKGDGTCFGSLVWCCKITKPCYLRDEALARIGLSEKDYMMLKRNLAEELLKP